MKILNLTQGFGDFEDYKLFKFPGGEIHYIQKLLLSEDDKVLIRIRVNSSDDILALGIVVDTIRKDLPNINITVMMPYFAYQQADRDFGQRESFSLKTITKILNTYDVDKWIVFDAHSDVGPALLDRCTVKDNSQFIMDVLVRYLNNNEVTILAPDAGAYKKIFKLAEKIGFKGKVKCANKYRDTTNGNIKVELPSGLNPEDDILIIDDICVGGRTFLDLADLITSQKVEKPGKRYLAVSHGVFSNGFIELSKRFDRIFTTNSRVDKWPGVFYRESRIDEPLKRIDISDFITIVEVF